MSKTSTPPPEISSRYQSLKLLGSGAMGSVYQALDTILKSPVAIKIFSASGVPDTEVDYFKQEFQTVAELEHPNLVKVFDFGQTASGDLFYSMELMPAGTLDSQPLPLSQQSLLSVAAQLCRALQYIHSRGIIHRDLKPGNVLLQSPVSGDRVPVKLTDFGLAMLPKGRSSPASYGGTPAYAAPETLAHGTVDYRADLFSLGVLLYELGTGVLPFSWQGGSIGPIATPTSLNNRLSKEVDKLVLKLMEFDPSNRYRDANSVIEAINHLFGLSLAEETAKTSVSYALTPALVGREHELGIIRSELAALARVPVPGEGDTHRAWEAGGGQAKGVRVPESRAGLILISGPTGIGKSRLVQEAKLFCQLNGVAFCQGGSAGDSSVPGAPLIESVRALLSTLPAGEAPRPGPVLDSLLGRNGRKGMGEAPDRSSFAESVYQLVSAVPDTFPTVICVEDLQWADPLTLEALSYLARGLFLDELGELALGRRIRLLITADDTGSLSKDRKRALGELRCVSYAINLTPRTLTVDQTAEVVASMFGPRAVPEGAAKRLHASTGGLPLFLQQLMAQLVHEGVLAHEQGRWRLDTSDLEALPAPKGARERVEAIRAGLSPRERTIAETASVLLSAVDAKEISGLTGLAYGEVRRTTRAMCDRALLVERGGSYSLQAGPLRDSVYRSVAPRRRRKLHLQAARLIEKRLPHNRARVHALAHHYLAARDPKRGIEWGLAAARDSRSSQANREAISYYRRLLELNPGAELRPQILQEYGGSLAATGDLRQAIEIYKEAYRIASRADDPRKVEVQRLAGEAFVEMGDLTKARYWLGKAAGDRTLSPWQSAHASAVLAFVEHSAGRPDAADRWLRQSGRAVGSPQAPSGLKCRVNRTEGMILSDRGKLHDAIPYLKRALREARAAKDPNDLLKSYSTLGIAYQRLYMHAQSLRAATAAMKIARRMSAPVSIGTQLMNIGAVHYDRGEFTALSSDLLEASSLFWRTGAIRLYSQCLGNLGLVHMEMGRYDMAFEYLERALSIQLEHGYGLLAIVSHSVTVSVMLQTGQIDEALSLARRNLRRIKKMAMAREVLMAQKDVAEALALKGELAEALRLLRLALEGFENIGERDETFECLVKLAALEEKAGRREKALSLSSRAVKLARSLRSKPSLLKAMICVPPRYAKDVQLISSLASRIESPELRWRSHAACAEYFIRREGLSRGLEEYEKCLAVFRSVTADIKEKALRDMYVRHPDRLAVISKIHSLSTRNSAH